jgi:hypothetical protein
MNPEQLFLSDNLKLIASDIPADFICPESAEALLNFCSSFSIFISQDVGIEIKLFPADFKADFAFSIEKDSPGCRPLPDEILKKESEGISGYSPVKQVLQKWNADKAYNIIKRLWLEFDNNGSGYNPVPSFFVEFEEGIFTRNYKSYSSFVKQDLFQIKDILDIADMPDRQREIFCRFLLNFDYTTPLYETGAMLSRKNSGIRIVFADFGICSLSPILLKLGYAGNIKRAEQLYLDVKEMFDYLILHINWQGNGSYFAVECYFNNKKSIDEELRWEKVIEYIQNNYGIEKEKFKKLLHYPGIIETEPSYPFRIIKRFNHIKFILKNESDIEIKAYLGMRADYKF